MQDIFPKVKFISPCGDVGRVCSLLRNHLKHSPWNIPDPMEAARPVPGAPNKSEGLYSSGKFVSFFPTRWILAPENKDTRTAFKREARRPGDKLPDIFGREPISAAHRHHWGRFILLSFLFAIQ